jgi:hypothetical protein
VTDIDHRIAALEAQLAELKASVAETAPKPASAVSAHATGALDEPTSRRSAFKKMAGVAAGVAVGGVLASRPELAAATDGSPFDLGVNGTVASNQATVPTGVNFTGAGTGGTGFLFQSGTTWLPTAADFPCALAGYADAGAAARHGIYGWTGFDDHYAVVGAANTSKKTVGGYFRGGRANVALASNLSEATLTLANVKKGDLIFTAEGNLWLADVDGNLVLIGGAATAASAGQLFLLDKPVRVYDSRATSNGPAATGDGPLAGGTERTVSLANGFVNTTATAAVPAGAAAALITLTVTGTTNAGFMAVFSNAVAYPGTSNINWSTSGQDIATTTVSAVDATAKVKLHGGGSPTGTNFIIDVTGYYG